MSVRGLFLLYEGLPPTVIESQVFAHVAAMKQRGIEMQVWAYAVTQSAHRRAQAAQERLARDYDTTVITGRASRPALPLSEVVNAWRLLRRCRRLDLRPEFIHARTEYAATVALLVRPFLRCRVVWDARGDSISEFKDTASRFGPVGRFLAPVKSALQRARLALCQRWCDGAIFVSAELRRLHGRGLPDERATVIPCLADESLFFHSESLRHTVRTALGMAEDDIVITYVGSTAAWQCVPETVTLMHEALRASPRVRCLVVTSNTAEFAALFDASVRERVTILSCPFREVNRYLNAADFGVLLRKRSPINWVASPIKFGEYSLAGLCVVSTAAVAQVVEFGQAIGNVIDPGELPARIRHFHADAADRAARAQRARLLVSRARPLDPAALYGLP